MLVKIQTSINSYSKARVPSKYPLLLQLGQKFESDYLRGSRVPPPPSCRVEKIKLQTTLMENFVI